MNEQENVCPRTDCRMSKSTTRVTIITNDKELVEVFKGWYSLGDYHDDDYCD